MRGQCSNPPRVYPCREDYGAYKGKRRLDGGFGGMMPPGKPAPGAPCPGRDGLSEGPATARGHAPAPRCPTAPPHREHLNGRAPIP